MSLAQLVGIATAIAFGSALQSAVGFGMGLLSIPLFLWMGLDAPSSVALLLGAVVLHSVYNLYRARADVLWKPALRMTLIRMIAIPVGVLCLGLIHELSVMRIKQVVGATLLISLGLIWRAERPLSVKAGGGLAWVAGLLSGLLAGVIGMGGPPVVLYALSQGWPKGQTRAYIWALVLLSLPFQIGLVGLRFGLPALGFVGIGLLHAPVVFIGSRLGLGLSARWSRATLQRAVLLALAALALTSLAAPWF